MTNQIAVTERYEHLELARIVASKTNPRTHFDEDYISSLAGSIADKGVLEPILVRRLKSLIPSEDLYEIVAGECRFRASKTAGVGTIPAIVRNYTDEQVLEIQLIENLHRQDLRPLERARGFRKLIDTNPTKHSAESIAQRIGLSASWVWDLMKLLDLIPEAQELLEQERISMGHAIPLARLKPEDQKRAINRDHGGLFEDEDAFLPDLAQGEKAHKYDGMKVRSIREFTGWIADHIRFDVAHAAQVAPLQFEEQAEQVAAAKAKPGRGKKLVAITFSHYCPDGAKTDDERTYGSTSWKRADGQEKSKPCEYAVLGVVVAGEEGYGQQFDVCIARDKCRTHWAKEIGEKEKTQKLRESGKVGQAQKREQDDRARRQREEEADAKKRKDWELLRSQLNKAANAAAAKHPATLPKHLFAMVLKINNLPASTKPAGLAKALLEQAVKGKFTPYAWYGNRAELVSFATVLGVDVKALMPKAEKVQTSGATAKKPAKGKKTAAA